MIKHALFFILINLVLSEAYAESTKQSIFNGIIFTKEPDSSSTTGTTSIEKIANEIDRPCQKKEFNSWKSSNPQAELSEISSGMLVELVKKYTVINQIDNSPVAQKLKANVYTADSKDGKGQLTVVWTTSASNVVLWICGNEESLLAKTQQTTSKPAIKVSDAQDPLDGDPGWIPVPSAPSDTAILSNP